MAKKKLTSHSKRRENQENRTLQNHEQPQDQVPITTEDPTSEKLESLKSLNAFLLKETHERRKQVESLSQSKNVLEAELNRSDSEVSRLSDESAALELGKSVMGVFMGAQFDGISKKVIELMGIVEKERGISSRAVREKGEMKREVHRKGEEVDGLRRKVGEMEARERDTEGEVRRLKAEYSAIVDEQKEKQGAMKELIGNRDLLEKKLADSLSDCKGLEEKIEEIAKEKGQVERIKDQQTARISEFEQVLRGRNELILGLRKEEERLCGKVYKLEKSNAVAIAERDQMLNETSLLQEEKMQKSRQIEVLVKEKDMAMEDYEKAMKELKDEKQRVRIIIEERDEIEKLKLIIESELANLQRVLNELRCERDELQTGFDEERGNVTILRMKLSELEKCNGDRLRDIGSLRSECETINKEKAAMEFQIGELKKEKDRLHGSLEKSHQEGERMRAKAEGVLAMLKNAATSIARISVEGEKDERGSVLGNEERGEGEEIKPYADEVGKIRNAFRSRESKVEDMKRQLQLLQTSMAEARKHKGIWALVSSVTTALAAASFVYAARGG